MLILPYAHTRELRKTVQQTIYRDYIILFLSKSKAHHRNPRFKQQEVERRGKHIVKIKLSTPLFPLESYREACFGLFLQQTPRRLLQQT